MEVFGIKLLVGSAQNLKTYILYLLLVDVCYSEIDMMVCYLDDDMC